MILLAYIHNAKEYIIKQNGFISVIVLSHVLGLYICQAANHRFTTVNVCPLLISTYIRNIQ